MNICVGRRRSVHRSRTNFDPRIPGRRWNLRPPALTRFAPGAHPVQFRVAMAKPRDPKKGPKPSPSTPKQRAPGVERKLKPAGDHGERSYEGSGKLSGRRAIITGGDSGIGRAVAIAFAREGADVAIGYFAEKEEEDARETARWVEKAGRKALIHRFD